MRQLNRTGAWMHGLQLAPGNGHDPPTPPTREPMTPNQSATPSSPHAEPQTDGHESSDRSRTTGPRLKQPIGASETARGAHVPYSASSHSVQARNGPWSDPYAGAPSRQEGAPLASADKRGRTFIADQVVQVIARMAAEQVEGVHRIGEPSLRNFLARLGRGSGIEAEVGMQEAAADIEVVIEYGYPIRDVASNLRLAIIHAIEHMTGRRVVEVNVHVVDVHIPRREPAPRRELL